MMVLHCNTTFVHDNNGSCRKTRPINMRAWDNSMRCARGLRVCARARSSAACGIAAFALVAMTMMSLSAFAQEAGSAPVVGTATLPRDLSPWGMFVSADLVVQGV